jgi:hypothetical protein
MKRALLATILILLLLPISSLAITRDSIMHIAYTYSTATWLCSTANADTSWNEFKVERWYTGAPYNMGGWDSLSTCFWKLANGVIAGNSEQLDLHTPSHAGVDCSGFVTRCWGIDSGKMYTWTLPSISREIDWSELVRGDILNRNVGSGHVRLFDYFTNGTKQMMVYESTVGVRPGSVVHRIVRWNKKYTPRRYNQIEELPYPHPPYQDLMPLSKTLQQPWIIGGVGKVGAISWNIIDCSTTENGLEIGSNHYVGQLTQKYPGLCYAYTGSSTDSNYTVEANVWCQYNSAKKSVGYSQLLAYFNPEKMYYINLYADFVPGKDRQRLCLKAHSSLGTVKTLKIWRYPADFPDPKGSGWHHVKLSMLDGKIKVWFDGKKLSEPVGRYRGLDSGYVACSQYSNATGKSQTSWFDDLKVYPTSIPK